MRLQYLSLILLPFYITHKAAGHDVIKFLSPIKTPTAKPPKTSTARPLEPPPRSSRPENPTEWFILIRHGQWKSDHIRYFRKKIEEISLERHIHSFESHDELLGTVFFTFSALPSEFRKLNSTYPNFIASYGKLYIDFSQNLDHNYKIQTRNDKSNSRPYNGKRSHQARSEISDNNIIFSNRETNIPYPSLYHKRHRRVSRKRGLVKWAWQDTAHVEDNTYVATPERFHYRSHEWQLTRVADATDGSGEAVIYVFEAGLDLTHQEFSHVDGIKEKDGLRGKPYPKTNPNYGNIAHGTRVLAKIVGERVGVAKKAKVVFVTYHTLSARHSYLSIIDGLLQAYGDIRSRFAGRPVIINLSLGFQMDKYWLKQATTSALYQILRELEILGNVVVVVATENEPQKFDDTEHYDILPLLSHAPDFEDFIIPVGSINLHSLEEDHDAAKHAKIWAIGGEIPTPMAFSYNKWEISRGSSYGASKQAMKHSFGLHINVNLLLIFDHHVYVATPQVSAMLAYYCGLGFTLQEAKKLLYMYAYPRKIAPEKRIPGIDYPKVIYNGAGGLGCGDYGVLDSNPKNVAAVRRMLIRGQPKMWKSYDKCFPQGSRSEFPDWVQRAT